MTALQCHEWMRQECAALNLARQQREDAIVTSVTNISSAALLAIPGLLFSKGLRLPEFGEGWALYVGFACFGMALTLAFLEQILSSSAYRKQAEITQKYYRLESEDQDDKPSVRRVNNARQACVYVFGAALAFSALGLSQIRSEDHGQSTVPSSSAAAAAAAAAAASAAATTTPTPTVAVSSTGRGLRERSEIRTGRGSPVATQAVKSD
jgi:drug/metabolite transporter (DMT)-like permease